MDITQLKAEHPDLVAQISAEAEANGITKERKRREQILALRGTNAEGDKAIEAAIASGESFPDASPGIMAAIIKGTGGENPPPIVGAIPDTGSGASDLTADDIAAAKIVGMSLDEYRQYKDKE